jgi:hypothetical protein
MYVIVYRQPLAMACDKRKLGILRDADHASFR